MKNIYIYYLLLITPLVILLQSIDHVDNDWFVFAIMFYLLPYRMILDTWRLLSLEVIEPDKIWINLLPFYRLRYYRALFWGIDTQNITTNVS